MMDSAEQKSIYRVDITGQANKKTTLRPVLETKLTLDASLSGCSPQRFSECAQFWNNVYNPHCAATIVLRGETSSTTIEWSNFWRVLHQASSAAKERSVSVSTLPGSVVTTTRVYTEQSSLGIAEIVFSPSSRTFIFCVVSKAFPENSTDLCSWGFLNESLIFSSFPDIIHVFSLTLEISWTGDPASWTNKRATHAAKRKWE